MYISKKFENMQFGGLYEIFKTATDLESTGKQLVHMEIGRPDFVSPDIAIQAVKESLDRGEVHYTEVEGPQALREAIVEKEKRRHNLDYCPNDELVVTAGACEALSSIFVAFLDPGDEVVVLGPYFSAYTEQAQLFGFKLVELELKMENEWKLEVEKLKELITPRTKMILVNSPNNPGGYILSREELQKIADIAKEHDLLVISDECYDEFTYGSEHISIAQIDGMRDRTLVVKSTSKSFSMTGWRIGYVLTPNKFKKYINKVHQNMSTCASSFAQFGAVKAFTDGDDFIDNMVDTFEKRGDYFYDAISKIDGLEIVKPKGAFYMFPKITNYNKDDFEMADILLRQAGVVSVPGSFFGKSGKGHIRLAYCRSMEELETAAKNMKKVLENL